MAFSAEQLNIIVAARTERLEKSLKDAEKRIKGFERQTKKSLSGSTNSFAMLAATAKRFLPALGAAAVIQSVKRVTSELDSIGKKADQIGLTTDAFQELIFVAEGAGVSQEKFTSSMERFSKRLGEATLGAGAAAKMLKTMGLDAKELTQIPLDEALNRVADRMNKIEDPTQKAAAAAAIFGREGVAMVNMMREGSAGLNDLRRAANEAGAVIDEDVIRNAEEMQTKLDAANRVIRAQLNEALVALSPLLIGAAQGFADLAKRVGDFLREAEPVDQTMNQLVADVDYLKSILGEGVSLDQIVDPAGQAALASLEDSLFGIGVEAFEAATAIQTQIDQLENLRRAGKISGEESEALKAKLQALKVQLNEMATGSLVELDTQEAVTKLEELEQDAIDVADQLAAIDEARFGRLATNLFGLRGLLDTVFQAAQRAAAAIPGARVVTRGATAPGQGNEPPGVPYYVAPPADEPAPSTPTSLLDPETPSGGKKSDPLADLMKRIELERQLLGASDARRQVLEAIANSDKKYTDDAIDGAVARIEAYEAEKQAMERIQAEQQQIADTLQSSMESAFMSIVDGTKTAEEAFKDMARQIIMELYRVLVVQRLVGSFNSTTGQGTGIVGGIMRAVTGMASGGSVQAGRPYMTGESGRELFIPSTGGRILSPAQTSAAMRGGQQVIVQQTINVSTGVQQTVRSEIQTLLPQISEAAKSAVADSKRRGGAYGRAFA